ncbi:hypothetical protein ACOSQ3_027012 [Xanthoceras sorbifolium]
MAGSTLGTYKINSDASLFAKTDIPAELPEAMGIQIGPSMAKDARLSPMVVECDAQVLVQLFCSHSLPLSDIGIVHSDIYELMSLILFTFQGKPIRLLMHWQSMLCLWMMLLIS